MEAGIEHDTRELIQREEGNNAIKSAEHRVQIGTCASEKSG